MASSLLLWMIFFQGGPLKEVPEPLKPWTDWVLVGHEDALCTHPFNDADASYCAWPGRLRLEMKDTGGRFSQTWTLEMDTFVPLPGGPDSWPEQVRLNGKKTPVVSRDNHPAVYLSKGRHTISGQWSGPIQGGSIQVPKSVGLIDLWFNGSRIHIPRRDEAGAVWLEQQAVDDQRSRDSQELHVARLFNDDHPFSMTVHYKLNVSGKSRELNLGNPLLEGFKALSLSTRLPARFDESGNLILQARAGAWDLELVAIRDTPPEALACPERTGILPDQETWCYNANRALRRVALSGLVQVDPKQTVLPNEWKKYAAYAVGSGGVLTLEEHDRGFVDRPARRFELSRTLWLDFEGNGYTFSDNFYGSLEQNQRLSLAPPFLPGRINVGGEDQLITQDNQTGLPGVELRRTQVTLSGEGRIEARPARLPASGWSFPVSSVSTSLHLPPGWRVLGLIGPDMVEGDWLHSWRLWDFFWVLLLGFATAKLWDLKWGLLGVMVMTLLHGETNAPTMIWFALLAAVALARVTPAGKISSLVHLLKWVFVVILVLKSVVFIHHQVRQAIYPDLHFGQPGRPAPARMIMPRVEEEPIVEVSSSLTGHDLTLELTESLPTKRIYQDALDQADLSYQSLDLAKMQRTQKTQRARIQTGPGLPDWDHRVAYYSWEGAISNDQDVRLLLLPPLVSAVLCFLRVALLIPLILLMTDRRWQKPSGPASSQAVALILLPLLVLPGSLRAQEPSPAMLRELRQKLLTPKACFPHCAEMPTAQFSLRGDRLIVELEVHAAEDVAIPLPGKPIAILRDGEVLDVHVQDKDGAVWAPCPAGIHGFRLELDATGRDSLELTFPLLKPRRAEVTTEGWEVSGVHESGKLDEQVEFRRLAASETASQTTFEGGELAAYGTLTRQLVIDRDWFISTTLIKKAGVSLVTTIPLLPGENVVSTDARVEEDRVWINMTPDQTYVSWVSNIEPVAALEWTSSTKVPWREIWQLDAAPEWQVTWSGTPLIGYSGPSSKRVPFWLPRPGETLKLQIHLSEPVQGQIQTIEDVRIKYDRGDRATDYQLDMTVRCSLGGDHGIELPPGSEITRFSMNGVAEPVRFEAERLILPLVPGLQKVKVEWTLPGEGHVVFKPEAVNLHHPWVNTLSKHRIPEDRWLLWTGGPGLRPSVLFWSILLVVILVSFAAARIPGVPLKTHQWVLLGLGISQLHILAGVVVVVWFGLFAWRARLKAESKPLLFNGLQFLLVVLTVVFLAVLMLSLQNGLLGRPNIYLGQPDYNASNLIWYNERGQGPLPAIYFVSLPTYVFRALMLLWAFWLAGSLVRWLKWGWSAFSTGGCWRVIRRKVVKVQPPPTPTPTPTAAPEPPRSDAKAAEEPNPPAAGEAPKD